MPRKFLIALAVLILLTTACTRRYQGPNLKEVAKLKTISGLVTAVANSDNRIVQRAAIDSMIAKARSDDDWEVTTQTAENNGTTQQQARAQTGAAMHRSTFNDAFHAYQVVKELKGFRNEGQPDTLLPHVIARASTYHDWRMIAYEYRSMPEQAPALENMLRFAGPDDLLDLVQFTEGTAVWESALLRLAKTDSVASSPEACTALIKAYNTLPHLRGKLYPLITSNGNGQWAKIHETTDEHTPLNDTAERQLSRQRPLKDLVADYDAASRSDTKAIIVDVIYAMNHHTNEIIDAYNATNDPFLRDVLVTLLPIPYGN